jgi:hypothetical protein
MIRSYSVVTKKKTNYNIDSVGNQNLTISIVYLVEELNYNLLSVSKLCDVGYYIKFKTHVYYLMSSKINEMIYQGKR